MEEDEIQSISLVKTEILYGLWITEYGRKPQMKDSIIPLDIMDNHAIAHTLHTTIFISVKGVLDANGSILMSD